MNYSKSNKKTFRFNFWQDRFWVWFLLFPIGIACWIFPIYFYFKFQIDISPIPYFFMILIFVGIPCYLAGWIFIYKIMVWFYTRVVIDEDWIVMRHPVRLFPIIPKICKLYIPKIEHVDYSSSLGLGFVFAFYYRNQKRLVDRFLLPNFRFDHEYGKMIIQIRQKVDPEQEKFDHAERIKTALIKTAIEENNYKKQTKNKTHVFLQSLLKWMETVLVSWICVSNVWIIYSVFPKNPTAHFTAFGIGALLVLLGQIGHFPILGQLLLWVFGKNIIVFILDSIFQIQADILFLKAPDWANSFFTFFNIKPLDTSIVNYLFIPIFLLSIILSLQEITRRKKSTQLR